MKARRFGRGLCFLLLLAGVGSGRLWAQLTGGMLDPAMDTPGQPFSYFWHPTDVIGDLYDPVATEVTPEGYLYTGFGELMFFTGNPPVPVDQRIKTLQKGYLPIIQYHLSENGVTYSFTIFGADLGGGLRGLPVNFVRVQLHNDSSEDRAAFLSTAFRFSPPANGVNRRPDYRFGQKFQAIPEQYTDGQTKFDPNWKYKISEDALLRDGRIIYFFPANPEPFQVSLTLGQRGLQMVRYFTGEVEGNPDPKYSLDPHTPVGLVSYRVRLNPGQTQELIFKMPIAPIPQDSPQAAQVNSANYDQTLNRLVGKWEGLVGRPSLVFPEAKVQESTLANTVFDLLAIDKVGDDYIENVNKFQYHRPAGGANTGNMIVALDYLGLHDIAKKTSLYLRNLQNADGSLRMEITPTAYPYWEVFGYILWVWTRHYELTRDAGYLREIYPCIQRAMAWEEKIVQTDRLGLMPPTQVGDDAWLKNSHQTGQNMWVLVGLRSAITMAEASADRQGVQRYQAEYQRYWKAFEKQLSAQTARSGGYIPPSLDRTLKGNNWDNLLTLYPVPLFEPFDPRVTATIRASRATYSEGILGYVYPIAVRKKGDQYVYNTDNMLHYWQSPNNAENELVRDDAADQELAVKDLYALLLHTTSTHAPQEFGTLPWSTRDYVDGDILPDGASSGKMIELIRNMLVREYKKNLVLFSALSPAWMQSGKKIELHDAPTNFGPVSVLLIAGAEGFEVKLSNRFRQPPEHLIVPAPWFYNIESAEADGTSVPISDGKIVLPPDTRELKVRGQIRPGTPEMSFDHAVDTYKAEYGRRYEKFLQTGSLDLSEPAEK